MSKRNSAEGKTDASPSVVNNGRKQRPSWIFSPAPQTNRHARYTPCEIEVDRSVPFICQDTDRTRERSTRRSIALLMHLRELARPFCRFILYVYIYYEWFPPNSVHSFPLTRSNLLDIEWFYSSHSPARSESFMSLCSYHVPSEKGHSPIKRSLVRRR